MHICILCFFLISHNLFDDFHVLQRKHWVVLVQWHLGSFASFVSTCSRRRWSLLLSIDDVLICARRHSLYKAMFCFLHFCYFHTRKNFIVESFLVLATLESYFYYYYNLIYIPSCLRCKKVLMYQCTSSSLVDHI